MILDNYTFRIHSLLYIYIVIYLFNITQYSMQFDVNAGVIDSQPFCFGWDTL